MNPTAKNMIKKVTINNDLDIIVARLRAREVARMLGFGTIDQARFPLEYMANLFSAGDTEMIKARLMKLMAVRIYRRWKTVGDISEERAQQALQEAGLNADMAEAIYYLTALAKFDDRFVIPASHREQAIEMMEFTGDKKGDTGFGFMEGTAKRGL